MREPEAPKPTILVVDDDQTTRDSLSMALDDVGFQSLTAASGEEAMARLKLTPVDVVISDVRMGRISGVDLLTHVQEHYPDTAVVLVTGFGSVENAVDAIRRGAYDYITKPVNIDRVELVVQRALRRQSLVRENRELREEMERRFSIKGIVGRSPAMRRVFEQVEQVAPTNATVLILGESGVGKEVVARAIHRHSRRAKGPMVTVNCVALAETLIESELFGHERGAFTGANRTRRGRFELASGGTLFLDEIGDLSLSTQMKLLRAIQEKEIERVGGQSAIPVDIRLITATNQNLEQAITDSRFREELYYRLKVVTINIPPLRERTEDIPPLLEHFREQFCDEHSKRLSGFTESALKKLCAYEWRGNVRELRNVVESLVVTTRGDRIAIGDLPPSVGGDTEQPELSVPMGKPLAEVEKRYILQTLELLGGNKSRAAQVLGIGKKTLYRRLAEYGMLASEK